MEDFDAIKFAEETKDLVPRNSHLLGETALRNATSIPESAERAQKMQALGAPSFILENEKEILDKRIDRYVKEDYDVEKEIREPLMNAPRFVKQSQNMIFSGLVDEENFVVRTLKPDKQDLRGTRAFLLSTLGVGPKVPAVYYDFVGRLTEKNEDGNYVVSDATVKNFISWYHAKTAGKTKDILENMDNWWQSGYVEDLSIAVDAGILPESFSKNIEVLDENSRKHIKLDCGVLDAINAYQQGDSGEFFTIGGHCENNKFFRKKKIRLGLGNDEYSAMRVFYHELTHVIGGDPITFDGNEEAEMIFTEALTESISARIDAMIEAENCQSEDERREMARSLAEDVGYFGGNPYGVERKVLEYLQSGGKKVIDPMEFYEAYAEKDELYELIRDEKFSLLPFDKSAEDGGEAGFDMPEYDAFLDNPYRTYGPMQQKLIDDLLEAFPECKDLAGLGNLIVEKAKEFKNA